MSYIVPVHWLIIQPWEILYCELYLSLFTLFSLSIYQWHYFTLTVCPKSIGTVQFLLGIIISVHLNLYITIGLHTCTLGRQRCTFDIRECALCSVIASNSFALVTNYANPPLCLEYEIAFSKIAENGTLRYEDILKYFAECGHHPSDKEVDDAIAMVTNGVYQILSTPRKLKLVFHIIATWLSPIMH